MVPDLQPLCSDPANLPVVYIVDGSIDLTGALVCACGIARALEGKARTVIVLPEHGKRFEQTDWPFERTLRLPVRPLGRKFSAILLFLPALLWGSVRLRRHLHRDKAAVLVMNDFYLMHGVICRLLGFRGRLLTWIRISPLAFGRSLSNIWLSIGKKASDEMIAVSRHIQKQTPEVLTELIYDCIDPFPAQVEHDPDSHRLIYVGNYIEGKGQDDAIEAFALIAADFPGARLIFHGSDMGLERNRRYRDALDRRIDELGLREQIVLRGFCDAVHTALSGATASLNFSRAESFSMTVLEAQSMGLPVISTRSGGPQEIIVNGVTGLLVPVGDCKSMADAMRTLLGDPQKSAQMAKAARKHTFERFSPEKLQPILSDLVLNIAKAKVLPCAE